VNREKQSSRAKEERYFLISVFLRINVGNPRGNSAVEEKLGVNRRTFE
jgi:hypothetical protein